MKGTKILTLIALAAGAAVVGTTFAAWAVNDEADPFGVKVSPGSISTDDTTFVTLKYGSAPVKADVGNLEYGKPRMAAQVSLVADTNNGESYTGAFTMTLIDQTVGKQEGEAKLIDNLTVDLYDEAISYEAIGGELNAGALDGKTPRAHIPPTPGTYTATKTFSLSDNVAKTVYVVVSLSTNDANKLEQIASDVVYLQMDWGKGSNADVEASPIYFQSDAASQKVYAYAWKGDKVNAAFPGVLMEDEGNGLYSYLLSTGLDNVIFSIRNNDGEQTYKSADQAITSAIRTESPAYNKSTGAWGAKPDASLSSAYFLKGSINSWSASEDYALVVDSQDANHYSISGVNMPAGAKFKIWGRVADNWFNNDHDYQGCGFTIDESGNIVVSEQGVYTINLYVTSQDGNHVTLAKANG